MSTPDLEIVTNADPGLIRAAIDELAGESPKLRQDARMVLARIGEPAVPPLLEALEARGAGDERLRHEVLKVLGSLVDPAAADAFVRYLEDECADCRWVAAEGLVALGRTGLRRVLAELATYPETDWKLRGLHHVLSGLRRRGYIEGVVPVLKAFASNIPEIELPKAAVHALTWLKKD